jgi:molecular chaperone GrpE
VTFESNIEAGRASGRTDSEDPRTEERAMQDDGSGQSEKDADRAADTTKPQDEIEELRAEKERLEDQLKRALADLANFKRRQQQEAEAGRRAALEGVMGDLVNVLDIFGHALAAYDGLEDRADATSVESLVQGVRMTETMLLQTLERHGLAPISALGKPFDPNLHESAGYDENADPGIAEGHVSKVERPGYLLRGQVLRASRVRVAGSGENTRGRDEES